MADPAEKEFTLNAVSLAPDGSSATLIGRIGLAPQKLVLDRASWRKIVAMVEWAARQGVLNNADN